MAEGKATPEKKLGYDDYADTVAVSLVTAIRKLGDHVEETYDADTLYAMVSATNAFIDLVKVVNPPKEG